MRPSNFPGVKDPRKQSRMGQLADREVELTQGSDWSRNRIINARQLADAIERTKAEAEAARRSPEVRGAENFQTNKERGAKFKTAMEKGIGIGTAAPALMAAGVVPMGFRAGMLAATPADVTISAVNNDPESAEFTAGLGGAALLGRAAIPAAIAAGAADRKSVV